ncbi:protein commissureless 2 [Bactrocera tryoni]|uniref:protein commissureless 2 n=1 Tax=Bactrocera tryoni TaxID=59916 RepID=UPI001A99BAFA|nr:protein commissureless 2 [Bactrocera tryoni]
MEGLARSLNFELPHELPPLDKYAQQILENSKTIIVPATPTAPTVQLPTSTFSTSSDFLQRIGATLLNSVQLKKYVKFDNSPVVGASLSGRADDMDMFGMPPPPNHVSIDSSGFDAVDELQRQLEYDKFMNEVWIGIVLTLVLTSMVFCVCSCFLYHQFRTWKRNYRNTVTLSRNGHESEITKLHPGIDDPVPEYTLVSGLPSYEAALELLNKSPQSCLIVHPSVFSVFHVNEKAATSEEQPPSQPTTPQSQLVEVMSPLLPTMNAAQQQRQHATGTTTTTGMVRAGRAYAVLPTYEEANSPHNLLHAGTVTLTTVNEKTVNVCAGEAGENHTVLTMPTTTTTSTVASTISSDSDNGATHKN